MSLHSAHELMLAQFHLLHGKVHEFVDLLFFRLEALAEGARVLLSRSVGTTLPELAVSVFATVVFVAFATQARCLIHQVSLIVLSLLIIWLPRMMLGLWSAVELWAEHLQVLIAVLLG